ncbi:MAG: TatD family hydrolase [Clostridia bacterium]|nr:TatD family hydrolase [Clostridia bacterium]
MYFDTHAHLLSEAFDEDRETVIADLTPSGISAYVECGTNLEDSRAAADLAEKSPIIYAAVGVHPHDAKTWNDETAEELRLLLSRPRVVALGEIGLDYHYDFSPRDVQKQVFREQMALAKELQVPVIIHTREAWADTMEILREYPEVTGVMHCYSGSVETARELLGRGWYLAFGGAVTFKNAKKPLEAAKAVPLDRLLIETDSPYMTPVPHRGKRNDPRHVRLVAEKLAEVRGEDPGTIERATAENAERVFRLAASGILPRSE